ncbi:hypothetical protein [Dyadobacter alkalitolerans]|uniref:hypothetical protein n=1 Tax=Dyadobacter alkalitolerans TaxID=492736 RepID=UPI000412D30A|nr:hypothetical protein [Dyadobacter alkalitolerans]
MNKRTAKKLLFEQKEKLDEIKNHDDQWIIQTGSLIERIFGKSSNEYFYFYQFSFALQYVPLEEKSNRQLRYNDNVSDMKQFLLNCGRTIELVAFDAESKKNIMSNLAPIQFWGTILSVGFVVFGAGFSIGKYMSDVQNVALNQQVKTLSDSLSARTLTKIIPGGDSAQKSEDQDKKIN